MRIVCFCLSMLLAGAVLGQEEPSSKPSPPQSSTVKSRFYVGGWLGASYGDVVSSVQVAPELGYRVHPRFHLGGSLVYRYRKDKRFEPDLTTDEIGGALFGRYFAYGPIFVQGGVEQLSWDFVTAGPGGGLDVVNLDHTAILIGPGFALSMGAKSATYMTFLYDVNYDSGGPNPYDRPWMIRIGVGVGL